jgi:hypothetical protein
MKRNQFQLIKTTNKKAKKKLLLELVITPITINYSLLMYKSYYYPTITGAVTAKSNGKL